MALDIERLLAEEAKERQRLAAAATNAKLGRGETLPQKIAGASRGEARVQAAAIVGTNRQYVAQANLFARRVLMALLEDHNMTEEGAADLCGRIAEDIAGAPAESH